MLPCERFVICACINTEYVPLKNMQTDGAHQQFVVVEDCFAHPCDVNRFYVMF